MKTVSQTVTTTQKIKGGRFIGDVKRALRLALLEEARENGMTQTEIAKRLGVNKSVISRIINGTQDLTLRTVGEFARALGRIPKFTAERDQTIGEIRNVNDSLTNYFKKPEYIVFTEDLAINQNIRDIDFKFDSCQQFKIVDFKAYVCVDYVNKSLESVDND